MRVLMVSPFPPLRDGIGKYAAQEVSELRAKGHEVEILSPFPCAAHHVDELRGGLRPLRIRRYVGGFERVILQYHPSHYHIERAGSVSQALSKLAMLALFLTTRNLTVVCHEVDYSPHLRSRLSLDWWLERLAWRAAPEVAFHTEREVKAMERHFGVRPGRVVVRPHGDHFRRAIVEDRRAARARLGLAPDDFVFLCLGFIQPGKGFDRAIRAFRAVPGGGVRLYVVGSLRVETPENRDHLDELARSALADPRVEVRERALTDDEFDRWIVAADVVVLPYRSIWSSSVLERVKLLDRPAIVTDVGGLAEQVGEDDVLAADDRELARAMRRLAGRERTSAAPADLDVEAAWAHVREESARRRPAAPTSGPEPAALGLAVRRLRAHRAARPVALSTRPIVGPLATLMKQVVYRATAWMVMPVVDQLEDVQRRVADAVDLLAREVSDDSRSNGGADSQRALAEIDARLADIARRLYEIESRLGAERELAERRGSTGRSRGRA